MNGTNTTLHLGNTTFAALNFSADCSAAAEVFVSWNLSPTKRGWLVPLVTLVSHFFPLEVDNLTISDLVELVAKPADLSADGSGFFNDNVTRNIQDLCLPQLCSALDLADNPDLAGTGVIIAIFIEILLSLFFIGRLHIFGRDICVGHAETPEDLAAIVDTKTPFQLATASSTGVFFDSSLFFGFSAAFAALILSFTEQTVYNRGMSGLVALTTSSVPLCLWLVYEPQCSKPAYRRFALDVCCLLSIFVAIRFSLTAASSRQDNSVYYELWCHDFLGPTTFTQSIFAFMFSLMFARHLNIRCSTGSLDVDAMGMRRVVRRVTLFNVNMKLVLGSYEATASGSQQLFQFITSIWRVKLRTPKTLAEDEVLFINLLTAAIVACLGFLLCLVQQFGFERGSVGSGRPSWGFGQTVVLMTWFPSFYDFGTTWWQETARNRRLSMVERRARAEQRALLQHRYYGALEKDVYQTDMQIMKNLESILIW